jgi:hypothetical protein
MRASPGAHAGYVAAGAHGVKRKAEDAVWESIASGAQATSVQSTDSDMSGEDLMDEDRVLQGAAALQPGINTSCGQGWESSDLKRPCLMIW